MHVNLKNRFFVFASVLTSVAAAGPVLADSAWPEWGLKGMKRIELAYLVDNQSAGAATKGGEGSPLPADDLLSGDVAQHKECKAINVALKNAGLEIVEKCKAGDSACGKMWLTVQNESEGRTADRVFIVGAALSQPMTLVRDKKVELATPTTWSQHRVQIVPNEKSATQAACITLRGLATGFGAHWMLVNK